MARFLVLNEKDNVAVAIEPVKPGDIANLSSGTEVTAVDEIEFAHKIAIEPIIKGGNVIKYGEVIGHAMDDIKVGQHVHVHNIRTARDRRGGM